MLKINLQLFAEGESARFVETTLSNYKKKLSFGSGSDLYPRNDTIYFVSTNYTNGTDFGSPYLLYKGDQLLGNSSILEVKSNNSIANLNNNVFSNVKYRYLTTGLSRSNEGKYICHVYINPEFTYELNNNLIEFKDNYIDFSSISKNNLLELLKNIKLYRNYRYYDSDIDTLLTDTYEFNPKDIENLGESNLNFPSNSKEDTLNNNILYLNVIDYINDSIMYSPVAKVYRLSSTEIAEIKDIDLSNYLFTIEFASYTQPIVYNNLSYYLEELNDSDRISASGIYSIDIFKLEQNEFKMNISVEDDLKNEFSYIISNNTKFDSYYKIFNLNDYNNVQNLVDGEDVQYSELLTYGLCMDNSNKLYIFEKIEDNYSNLFRNFSSNFSTIENSYILNVDNVTQLSTAIPGVKGQVLFVINEYTNREDELSYGTNMYFWKEEPNGVSHWQNSNILYTTNLKLSDNLTLTDDEIIRLKMLLR